MLQFCYKHWSTLPKENPPGRVPEFLLRGMSYPRQCLDCQCSVHLAGAELDAQTVDGYFAFCICFCIYFDLLLTSTPDVLSTLLLFALSKPCSPNAEYFYKYSPVEEGGFEPPSKTCFTSLHTAITLIYSLLVVP